MITAFIGVMGSGKDYRKQKLMAEGAIGLDFKDALLEMAEDLVGFPIRDNYDAFKENIVGLVTPESNIMGPGAMRRVPAKTITAEVLAQYPQAMTGRRLLQHLGTEVMRKRDPDYWVEQWKARAKTLTNNNFDIVCADCRFTNEMYAIISLGDTIGVPYKFVFCDYKSDRYDATALHESEKMAQDYLKLGYRDGDIIK